MDVRVFTEGMPDEKTRARAARDIDIATFSAVLAAVNAWHEGVEEEEWSKQAFVAVEAQEAITPRGKAPSPRGGKGAYLP